MNPSVATESIMQLGNMYAGRWAERQKWGFQQRRRSSYLFFLPP
jgi:hypothetical protein